MKSLQKWNPLGEWVLKKPSKRTPRGYKTASKLIHNNQIPKEWGMSSLNLNENEIPWKGLEKHQKWPQRGVHKPH